MIFGDALLKGSSEGIRASQRCSESFSWAEKYSRTNSPTLPSTVASGLVLADSLDLLAALEAPFAAVFPFDFSLGAAFSTAGGFAVLSAAALSSRSILYC